MNGEVDPMYREARRVLLDVIEKLDGLRRSVVLVGAQAVHLRVADVPAQLVAYTTDGDIAIDPATVAPEPDLAAVMDAAGMQKADQPGIWSPKAAGPDAPTVDLLVPRAFADSPTKRGAVLRGHSANAARHVRGIEGCLVDCDEMTIGALDLKDARRFRLSIAGPGALLIAKLHKLGDRIRDERRRDRLEPKDAYEAYRLMQLQKDVVVAGWKKCLADERARAVASEAHPDVVTASAAVLANELLAELG